MTDQRECANCDTCQTPECCIGCPCNVEDTDFVNRVVPDTLFDFAPSTRTTPVHVSSGIVWPALSFLTAYHDLRAAGLVA